MTLTRSSAILDTIMYLKEIQLGDLVINFLPGNGSGICARLDRFWRGHCDDDDFSVHFTHRSGSRDCGFEYVGQHGGLDL